MKNKIAILMVFACFQLFGQSYSAKYYEESLTFEAKKDIDQSLASINKALEIEGGKREYLLQ